MLGNFFQDTQFYVSLQRWMLLFAKFQITMLYYFSENFIEICALVYNRVAYGSNYARCELEILNYRVAQHWSSLLFASKLQSCLTVSRSTLQYLDYEHSKFNQTEFIESINPTDSPFYNKVCIFVMCLLWQCMLGIARAFVDGCFGVESVSSA